MSVANALQNLRSFFPELTKVMMAGPAAFKITGNPKNVKYLFQVTRVILDNVTLML